MKDPAQFLTARGKSTNKWRVIKFTDANEIIKLESTLKEYIAAAIQIEKEGIKVEVKEPATDPLPQELPELFAEDHDFEKAYKSLMPGQQQGYLLYFNSPKQSKTRTSRIEQYRQRILNGKGFHDCVCG